MNRSSLATLAALALTVSAPAARAAPILAGPGQPGFDQGLLDLADGYQRQQDSFATLENGLSLDPIFLPAEVQTVRDFFAQAAVADFQQFSGKHPYAVLDHFDEHGDEGNFAGIASVGVAARLMVVAKDGSPVAEVARARDAAIRTAKAWHVYASIGGPGVVARGVRRVAPWSAGDPPFPGPTPATVPLKDGNGDPLPAGKQATWRDPVAPGYDGWIWFDDTSKDQVSGWALAALWLYDALHGDPDVPPEVTADLAADLTLFAKSLMKVVPELGIDLCIRDADGRLTTFHDLNPRQIDPKSVLPETFAVQNGFNAALALGIVRAAYHAGGDADVGRFYYEELVGKRDLPAKAASSAGIIFIGDATNYSNVNMLAIALATLARVETDPYVSKRVQDVLTTQFWDAGSDRDVSHVEQGWFDAIYGAFAKAPPSTIAARVAKNLGGFQPPPAFARDRQNCDASEIATNTCVGLDGTTAIPLASGTGHGGEPVAKDIVPMAIRPDSDFLWRSDPHGFNGSASTLMDPGGDYLAAYWLARYAELGDPAANLSPNARPALPYTLGADDAGAPVGDDAAAPEATPGDADGSSGCGCTLVGAPAAARGGALLGLLAAVGLAAGRRRRT